MEDYRSSELLGIIYPVGAIHTSTNSDNPNTTFGFGTWEEESLVPVQSEVYVTGSGAGAAGYGTTNNKIRRFTTSVVNIGTAITYVDSATAGASFTINTSGLYSIYALDSDSAAATRVGISKNSNQLTTSIDTITNAHRLAMERPTAAGDFKAVSVTTYLTAGDIIRAHNDGNPDATADNRVAFRIVHIPYALPNVKYWKRTA